MALTWLMMVVPWRRKGLLLVISANPAPRTKTEIFFSMRLIALVIAVNDAKESLSLDRLRIHLQVL